MEPPALRYVRVLVSGRVQGVSFRAATERQATKLGVCGWVRNCGDGRVEALYVGSPAAVAALLDWTRRGPSLARVLALEVEELNEAGAGGPCNEFRVRY